MTTLRITVQDWEIPDTLSKIELNIKQLLNLISETNELFNKVSSAQESMKLTCENVLKSQT